MKPLHNTTMSYNTAMYVALLNFLVFLTERPKEDVKKRLAKFNIYSWRDFTEIIESNIPDSSWEEKEKNRD